MKKSLRTYGLIAALVAVVVTLVIVLPNTLRGDDDGIDAVSIAATVVSSPDPQAAFDRLSPEEQDAVATALGTGVTITTVETRTVPRPERSK